MSNFFEIENLGHNEEAFTTLFQNKVVKVERIVSRGQTSPEDFYYDQDEGEWLLLLEGKAEIDYPDGKVTHLKKGDTLYLPPHKLHRVNHTSNPTLWLAIFVKEKDEQI